MKSARLLTKIFLLLLSFILILIFSPSSTDYVYPASKSDNKLKVFNVLSEGFEIAEFSSKTKMPSPKGDITILRINPSKWTLAIKSNCYNGSAKNLSARKFCEKEGAVAAINAGMFAEDHFTHVGYMEIDNEIVNPRTNSYKSAAAFSPDINGLPPFKIFDLDVIDIPTIRKQYQHIVQNLRLIKNPRKNVWNQQNEKWNELALGEDKHGNALFIYCTTPYSMHDFNKILLSLPIDIVAAQHLEGGLQAQMYVKINNFKIERAGCFLKKKTDKGYIGEALPIPNFIAVYEK